MGCDSSSLSAVTAATVLTIDLQAIVDNWRVIRDRVGSATCAAVVKADAYGLGAAQIAPALAAAGCSIFFVARLEEGIALRPLLPGSVLVALSGLMPGSEAEHLAHGVAPVLNSLDDIARWQRLAREQARRLPAWIHFDTGMNRLGLSAADVRQLAAEPERLEGLALACWLSHLACADQRFHPLSATQLGRFQRAIAQLPRGRRSLANSSGIFRNRAFHFDLVRPGAGLYGVNPTPDTTNPLKPVVTVRARILQVRPVDSAMTVGYGATHKMEKSSRIATIAAGYADGCLRSLADGGKAGVSIGGRWAPMVGRVSMDLITVDVGDLPDGLVQPGGWAELIGSQRDIDAVAADAGTIGYEVLTSLSRRHHRVWLASDQRTDGGGA